MTTTRKYFSTDTGAPIVERLTMGSLLAALRACLVTGYGTKSGAGWTEEYTGTNKAAFRNSASSGGTGCFVRFEDSSAASGRPCSIQTFASMSDIDTGVAGTLVHYLHRSPAEPNGGGANPIRWAVFADEQTFYVGVTQLLSGTNHVSYFAGAGDTASVVPLDAYRYFAAGQNTPSFLSTESTFLHVGNGKSGLGLTVATNQGLTLGRDYTGIGAASPHGVVHPGYSGVTYYLGDNLWPPRPSLNAADEAAMPAFIARGRVIRGQLRGLYLPISDMSRMTTGEQKLGAGFGGAGSECFALRHGGHNTAVAGSQQVACWVEGALPW
jgi:hypothetical protein